MTRYLTVEVTAEDIEQGIPGNPCECPMALAVARACPIAEPWVGWWTPFRMAVADRARPGARRLGMSVVATQFVVRFDAGKPVAPATFRLPLP